MDFTAVETEAFMRLAAWALEEDLAPSGIDLTSDSVIPADITGTAILVSRVTGTVAGLPAAEGAFTMVDPRLSFQQVVEDGQSVEPGTRLAVVTGRMRSMLSAERTALNFLQHLSGIATLTRRYVDLVADLPCKVLDTRKTTPGWRILEKYAVRCGGGSNHRMSLGDGVLIKDNHLAAIGPKPGNIPEAVRRARLKYGNRFPIEVEVDTLEQLDLALPVEPDIILLDNMSLRDLREAVRRRSAVAPRVLLEASGGINLMTLRTIAETGVDRISIGALTHSATALDIALDYVT
jgi:nicotinate-nucleotide pyrophosphorylase (carboxylating)